MNSWKRNQNRYFANLIFKRMAFNSLFGHQSLQLYLNLIFRSLVFTIWLSYLWKAQCCFTVSFDRIILHDLWFWSQNKISTKFQTRLWQNPNKNFLPRNSLFWSRICWSRKSGNSSNSNQVRWCLVVQELGTWVLETSISTNCEQISWPGSRDRWEGQECPDKCGGIPRRWLSSSEVLRWPFKGLKPPAHHQWFLKELLRHLLAISLLLQHPQRILKTKTKGNKCIDMNDGLFSKKALSTSPSSIMKQR